MKLKIIIKSGKKVKQYFIAFLLMAYVMLQTQCASSRYGQVPCPCEKKSHHR